MSAPGQLDPTPIIQMLQANQATAVLKTAIDLGVFAALTEGAKTDIVAAKIGCPARGTRILLDALAVLGLVARRGDNYELAPLARAFLVPGGPTYLAARGGRLRSHAATSSAVSQVELMIAG